MSPQAIFWTILGILILAVLITYYIPSFMINELSDISEKYLLSITTVKNPEIPVEQPFNRKFRGLNNSYPYAAGVAIDIDNSGHEEIFIGGPDGEDDVLLSYQDGKLVNIIDGTNLSSKAATYGGVSIDLDKDGYSDLIVARQDGVTLYKNNRDGTFSSIKILPESPDTSPVALSVTDFNKDGNADIYVSNFIRSKYLVPYQFNNPHHSKKNILLQGQGGFRFQDVTDQQGVAGKHNTFTSIFADLNNDSWPDLVVANDAGEIEIYENREGQFVPRKLNTGFGFWMGIGQGDIDNDGDLDLFLSNIGGYTPEESGLTHGDKKTGIRGDQKLNHQHVILRNDGKFQFTDVTNKYSGGDNYGFGWGGTFEDINLDGFLDLLFSVNYIIHPFYKYITHPHPVLINRNRGNKTKPFKQIYNYSDFNYGQTPLTIDVDQDGKKDVMWVNMVGPLKVYSNKTDNNYLNVKLPSSPKFANAKITLYLEDGRKFIRENVQGGVGFGSDQSEIHSFGLGKDGTKIDRVEVDTIYGDKYIQRPKLNSTLISFM